MYPIIKENDFTTIENVYQSIINLKEELPNMVFRNKVQFLQFITFDEIFMDSFISSLVFYLKSINEKSCFITALDPEPRNYFWKNFSFFGAFLISETDDYNTYLESLVSIPKLSVADSIMYNSQKLLISSIDRKWSIFADRSNEIAICSFSTDVLMKKFISIYGESNFLGNVENAARFIYKKMI